MFTKSKVSQSMIDAVNSVIENLDKKEELVDQLLSEEVELEEGENRQSYKRSIQVINDIFRKAAENTKHREVHTAAPIKKSKLPDRFIDSLDGSRRKVPAEKGENQHFSSKVALVKQEGTLQDLGEILDTKTAVKSYLDKSAEKRKSLAATGKLGDDSHRKINKSFAGTHKVLNREEQSFTQKVLESMKPQSTPDFDDIDESAMTPAQTKKKEEIVLSMKSKEKDFKAKYGKNWKNVMYATATKMAMKEEVEQVDEDSDDKFASDAYSTTRGKVVKNKSGVFFATNKSGSTKSFTSEKQANRHAMKEEYLYEENAVEHDDEEEDEALVKKMVKKKCLNSEGKQPDTEVPFVTNEVASNVSRIKKIARNSLKKMGIKKESYDEDPDVARADRELARMKAKPIKADRKTDPSKEMTKLSKRSPKEDDLDEETITEAKKDSYQVYHPSYSSAVQHAEKHLNKQGYEIHPDDWFHHINAGPTKPAEGKTVSLHIPLHKDGVPSKKVAHIQVYNRGNDLANNHELNMYHN